MNRFPRLLSSRSFLLACPLLALLGVGCGNSGPSGTSGTTGSGGSGGSPLCINTSTAVVLAAPRTLDFQGHPLGTVIADVNGDGKPDLVSFDQAAKAASVLLGQGDGTFGKALVSPAIAARAAAFGDLDGDGKLDLVLTADGVVAVSLGKGDGTFAAPVSSTVNGSYDAVIVVDLDGDGKLDVVATESLSLNPGLVIVLLNDGTGKLYPEVDTETGVGPVALAAADLNGDGYVDVMTANQEENTVGILRGFDSGGLSMVSPLTVGKLPSALAAADLDGNGKPDLVVVHSGDATLRVLLGAGGNFLMPAMNYPAGSGANAIAVADVNRDAKPDVVVTASTDHTVTLFLGQGDGTLAQSGLPHDVGGSPYAVAVGDLNGDGLPDIVVSTDAASPLTVLLGVCPQ